MTFNHLVKIKTPILLNPFWKFSVCFIKWLILMYIRRRALVHIIPCSLLVTFIDEHNHPSRVWTKVVCLFGAKILYKQFFSQLKWFWWINVNYFATVLIYAFKCSHESKCLHKGYQIKCRQILVPPHLLFYILYCCLNGIIMLFCVCFSAIEMVLKGMGEFDLFLTQQTTRMCAFLFSSPVVTVVLPSEAT